MKCFKCGTPDALILFSTVLCTDFTCEFYDRKHAEEKSPKGVKDSYDWVLGGTEIVGYFGSSGILIAGSSGII